MEDACHVRVHPTVPRVRDMASALGRLVVSEPRLPVVSRPARVVVSGQGRVVVSSPDAVSERGKMAPDDAPALRGPGFFWPRQEASPADILVDQTSAWSPRGHLKECR